MDIKGKIIRAYRYVRYGVPIIEKKVIFAQITNLSPNELLKGRIALVTGGSSGIGREIAHAFINAGAIVIITGRSMSRLVDASNKFVNVEDLKHKLFLFELDSSNIEQVNNCIPNILEKFNLPKIDILVNNAGINRGFKGCTFEENFDAIINTNLKGTFFVAKSFADYFKRDKIEGNILNIASSSSERPATDAYTLSKWGVKGLTKGLARVYSKYGIVVNAIAPGPTATPMIKGNVFDQELSSEKNLTGRIAHPIEIANMAVILVSNISRTVIGDVVYMSNGSGNVFNEDVTYRF